MVKQNKKANKPIVEGIIIPEKWDGNGKVTGVTIQTSDESIYLVEHTKSGQELLNLIHEKVEAKGKIRERLDGSMLIAVQSYRKVEEKIENGVT
ncbi:MAG: hypothetical protein KJO26_00420 [Deltaproteobacteria bacterium]|nr:hypothetical protein [Deltaproteobacteria bacterium]